MTNNITHIEIAEMINEVYIDCLEDKVSDEGRLILVADLIKIYGVKQCEAQVKAGVTSEGDIPYVILKIEKGDGIHTVIECTNCGDVKGMYLGMTCPLCKRAFRDVRTTPTIRG